MLSHKSLQSALAFLLERGTFMAHGVFVSAKMMTDIFDRKRSRHRKQVYCYRTIVRPSCAKLIARKVIDVRPQMTKRQTPQ